MAVRVAPGDRARGQVLVELDGRDLQAAARGADAGARAAQDGAAAAAADQRAAQAGLDLARASHGRIAGLHAKKSATAQELDEATAALAAAEARVTGAAARVQEAAAMIDRAAAAREAAGATASFLTVTAPFTGLVVERKAEPGMLAAPGMPLLVIEQAGGYRLEAGVEASRLGSIRLGAPVEVELETSKLPLKGRVEEIVPALDAASRTFTVKIGISGGGTLRSGMFGRARFAGAERKALVAPWSAVVEQGQVQKVFVVDGGVARGRMITTGARQDGTVEILSGLSAGEKVVAPVPAQLADGGKVEVR